MLSMVRWFTAGLVFMGINTVILYVLVEVIRMTVPLGTLVAAEACTLLRFFVNHYWVFGRRNPTLRDLGGYHVANAGAFVMWWGVANALTYAGMHYLLASVAAVGVSTLFSLWTNFTWIWKARRGGS